MKLNILLSVQKKIYRQIIGVDVLEIIYLRHIVKKLNLVTIVI